MEFSISQEKLSKALSSCGRVASTKAGLPILDNILIRTMKDSVLFAATNLELASQTRLNAKIDKAGDITVPAKLITEVVATLPKGIVDLSVIGQKLTISNGTYKTTINGVVSDEFPEIPSIDEKTSVQYEINHHEYKTAVNQVIFSASKDQTRPVLTGVFWHSFEGKIYLASSDGYRLAEKKLIDTKSDVSVIIPASTLSESVRLLTDDIEVVKIFISADQVNIRVDETELTSRLIDGKYPNYRELMPESNEVEVLIDSDSLVRTAKLAGLFSRDTGGSINLNIEDGMNTLRITTAASERGENDANLPAKTSGSGRVSLNSRYLLEALAVLPAGEVSISFSGKLSPIVVRSGEKTTDYTHIIMPLKS